MVSRIAEYLRRGGVAVIPTDTLYGIVGVARKKATVARIYRLRKRNPKKPMIILIASVRDLAHFSIRVDAQTKNVLDAVWPGKVSVVLPCRDARFTYLHRGTKTLAFRMPAKRSLRALLTKTGPLVAPSANFEGSLPATTIREARNYFGDAVRYVSGGRLRSQPSTILEVRRGKVMLIRKGAGRIPSRLANF